MSLQVNQLVGFGVGSSAPPAEITYRDAAGSTSNLTTYTFASRTFGTASSDRYIIVGASGGLNNSSARTVSSMTIGGVSATIVVQANDTPSLCAVGAIAIAAVPTGTTGDVVVTFSGNMIGAGVAIWSATSLQSATATNTASDTASPLSAGNFDVQAGGIAVGYTGFYGTAGLPTTTWAGLTEKIDAATNAWIGHSGASDAFAESSSLSTSATLSASAAAGGAFAAFR